MQLTAQCTAAAAAACQHTAEHLALLLQLHVLVRMMQYLLCHWDLLAQQQQQRQAVKAACQ
jgi:hypothetical protein